MKVRQKLKVRHLLPVILSRKEYSNRLMTERLQGYSDGVAEERDRIKVVEAQWENHTDYHIMLANIGYCRVLIDKDGIEITDLYVHPSYRNKGFATRLLDMAECITKGQTISIIPKEKWMEEWYMRKGYKILK